MNRITENLEDILKFENNTITGKNINIPNIQQMVDLELYLIEQENYGTENIEASGCEFEASIREVRGHCVVLDFSYKLWRYTVDGENLGTKTDKGEFMVNMFTNKTSISVDSTELR